MTARPIGLIGPPASGKTTVGAALAQALGVPFVDGDDLVAASTGMSRDDLNLDLDAEQARAAEVRALRTFLDDAPAAFVVAFPSAIVAARQGLELIARTRAVFLDVDLATSFPRTGLALPRPVGLLPPRALWRELLDARRPHYAAAADQTVEVSGMSVDQIVDAIATR